MEDNYIENIETVESTYTIILADQTELKNLHLNGNNFVSDVEVFEDQFQNNLSPVTIREDATGMFEEHPHMELVQIAHYEKLDGWYLILRDISQKELDDMKLKADIEYLAMMTEVDL